MADMKQRKLDHICLSNIKHTVCVTVVLILPLLSMSAVSRRETKKAGYIFIPVLL